MEGPVNRQRVRRLEAAVRAAEQEHQSGPDPRELLLEKLTRRPDEPLGPSLTPEEGESLVALLRSRAEELTRQDAERPGRYPDSPDRKTHSRRDGCTECTR